MFDRLTSLRWRLFAIWLIAFVITLGCTVYFAIDQLREASLRDRLDARNLINHIVSRQEQALRAGGSMLAMAKFLQPIGDQDQASCAAALGVLADHLQTREGWRNFGDLLRLNDRGVIDCATTESAVGEVLADRFEGKITAKMDKSAISGVVRIRPDLAPALVLFEPILNPRGQQSYTLCLSLRLRWLEQYIDEERLGPRAKVFIIDGDDRIYSGFNHSDPASLARFTDLWRGKAAGRSISGMALELRFANDRSYLLGYRQVTGTKTKFAIMVPLPSLLESLSESDMLVLLAVCAVTLLAVIAAMIASDVLVLRRIARIHDVADALLAGEMSARVGNLPPQDEIQDLARTIDTLATEVERRITELARSETALLQAKNAAQQADSAKSDFLAKMSHELRTPLNAIIGFSEIMTRTMLGEISDKYREYANHISTSGRHLLDIVNDILDLSKVESGQMTLAETNVDVRQTVDEIVGLMTPLTARSKARLKVIDSGNGLVLRCDRTRLKQILTNIVGNAVKFTPDGEIEVKLGEAEGCIWILVHDEGLGMQPDQIGEALRPFGQVRHDAYTSQVEGTGLGLPLTKKLMELHGGSLEITSTEGEGTSVLLIFPAERTVAPADAGPTASTGDG